MAKKFYPFDSGDGSTVRTSQWSAMMSAAIPSGVVKDFLNQMQVYADSTGMQIKIKSGAAWIMGHYYANDSEEVLAIDASHATLARWDLVALQVDWAASNNQISTVIVKGTASASPSLPALTQTTSKWQIPLAKIVVAAAAITIAAGAVADMRSFMGGTSGVAGDNSTWTNKSGIQLTNGMVVVNDPNNDNAVRTTTIEGDQSAVGVVDGIINVDSSGTIVKSGRHVVLVVGNVTRGHRLIPSTTPGYAKDSGYTQKNGADLGIAKTSFTGSVGTVEADLDIHPANGANSLQLLTTTTPVIGTASFTVPVTIENGTDLLVVCLASKKASTTGLPTAVTIEGVSMTLSANEGSVGSSLYGVTYAILRLPPIGIGKTLSITAPASSEINGVAIGFVGSASSPTRTKVYSSMNSATTVSGTPDSVVSDLVLDVICTNVQTVWTPNGGQTIVRNDVSKSPQLGVSIKAGAAGTTSMGWSGASTYGFYSAIAIKGA